MTASKRSVEERADRFQRRYTGPFQTAQHEIGPVALTVRYRRRQRIDVVRLNVAGHDLWTHAIVRGELLPFLRRLVAAISRG